MMTLTLIPLFGILFLAVIGSFYESESIIKIKMMKSVILAITVLDLLLSLLMFIFFDYSSNQFQFVHEQIEVAYFNIYLGIDGLSIYFVLLTTLIMPISLISNWKSIKTDVFFFLAIILLLETLLLIVFLVLDVLLFYIFFESILAPLFILIGLYGSNDRVIASFYFFLYTLWGSLFMLLSIITIISILGIGDLDTISKYTFLLYTQLFMFYGIFLAFSVKTPVIYLNSWLLKAHVESPLTGSIVLAAIVLKLSLYGILRLILSILPKAFIHYTYIIFLIGVITIFYASLSTLRTVDIKELIAYSSVCHAAVYLVGVFSNILYALCGAITLGLAHGFVSSGLFISAGGVLYDRSTTRSITYYKGMSQIMPLFSILFFILCLGNCSAPLTLNFIGEFLSLYGVFERLSLAGVLSSSSIVFSAAYTIFMFNRICFAGTVDKKFWENLLPDLKKREFYIMLSLVIFTVFLGIYPAPLLNGLDYYLNYLVYYFNFSIVDSLDYVKLALFPAFLSEKSFIKLKNLLTFSDKNYNTNKSLLWRIGVGIKKGFFTHTLPEHIIKFNNNPFIQIFIVLGGLSFLLIITHKLDYLGEGLLHYCTLIFCSVMAFIFNIYFSFMSYHRIKHMIKVFNTDQLDVRNSPLDILASISTRLLWSSKGFCGTYPAKISFIWNCGLLLGLSLKFTMLNSLILLLEVYSSSIFIPNWSDIFDHIQELIERLIALFGDDFLRILAELIRILGQNFTFIISLLILYYMPLIKRMIINLFFKLFPTVRQKIRIKVCRVIYNQNKYFALYDNNDSSCLLLYFMYYGQWHNIYYRYVNVGERGIFRFALIFIDSRNIIHHNQLTTPGNIILNLASLRYHVYDDYDYQSTDLYSFLVDGYRIHWRNLFTNTSDACFVIMPDINFSISNFFAIHHVGVVTRTIGRHMDTQYHVYGHLVVVADKRDLLLE